MEKRALLISKTDNVATVVSDSVEKGELVDCEVKKVKAIDRIPFGHKIAIADINKDDVVIKYGEPIGKTIEAVRVGEHVHTHNVMNLK
jgi:altronate dehydratase small subunit